MKDAQKDLLEKEITKKEISISLPNRLIPLT
jgi:hypothetical protein